MQHGRGLRSGFAQFPFRPQCTTAFKRTHCDGSQVPKHGTLRGVKLARLLVNNAQRTGIGSIAQAQRGTGVEANVRVATDQAVVDEARVARGIRHFKNALFKDGMRAKGQFAGGFSEIWKAYVRLEPLAVGVDQADQRNRHPAYQCSGLRKGIKFVFRWRIENAQVGQGAKSRSFVGGDACS